MDEAEYQENLRQQEEELEAVSAIFGDDCTAWVPERRCEIWLPHRDATPCVVLRAKLPAGYPSREVAQVEVEARHLDADLKLWMVQQIAGEMSPGSPSLFAVAEWIKEQDVLFQGRGCLAAAPATFAEEEATDELCDELKAAVLSSEDGQDNKDDTCPVIVTGPPFVEKKSAFQAHVATVHSTRDVERVMDELLKNSKIRNATHNIMAYRIHCPERGTFLQDHDDDGEQAAGGRLLHLLQIVEARDVMVVVSRWYGGIHLGPARFTIINNVARELLVAEGYLSHGKGTGDSGGGGKAKKGSSR